MKGYYIHFFGRAEQGVSKKIDAQLEEFRKVSEIEEIAMQKAEDKYGLLSKVIRNLPLVYGETFQYEKALGKITDADYIYLRRTCADKHYIKFLGSLKRQNPNAKLIVELPTFPYFRDDYAEIKNVLKFLKEIYAIPKFKKYVDAFATYTDDCEIYGIPTLRIKNGLHVDEISPRSCDETESDVINLLAVATFRKHHGYERIIQGIANYYANGGKENIQLRMVGSGPEQKKYEEQVKKLNLEKKVLFFGKKTGSELDQEYAIADIALGSFGMYKIDVFTSSVLKVREYLSKGIPIVSGCHEDAFEDETFPYYMEFPNDSSIIAIDKIVDFYHKTYSNSSRLELTNDIRAYAQKHINYDVVFQNVIDYVQQSNTRRY